MFSLKNKGFSLIELSISITIIALLVAAVTTGKNIRDRLKLTQVITDIGNINSAVKQFMDEDAGYGAMPGDFFNALTKLEGATGQGDGDETLEDLGGANDEHLLFWQHLALAGAINGSYDGVTNGPEGRMEGPLKSSLYAANTLWNGSHEEGLYISVEKTSAGNGLFTTKQAFDYDSKYDNSNPNTGSIRATDGANASAGDCVTVGGEYNLSNDRETPCIVHFFFTPKN